MALKAMRKHLVITELNVEVRLSGPGFRVERLEVSVAVGVRVEG